MLRSNLHFGLCPEDKLLNLLGATIKRLQELLHSERTSSAEGPGSGPTQASVHPLEHGDSASALKKLLHIFKEWSVLHTHRVGSLREALSTTVHALTEQDRDANHVHALPKRETQAIRVGASRECHFYKHVYITDAILSVLEDVHSIEKKLFLVTSKFDRAITIISGAKLESTEAETVLDDLTTRDLMTHSMGRLVLPQIFSKDQCVPQKTDPEYTSKISPSDIQKCVTQSTQNTEAENHATFERKTGQHGPNEPCNGSPIDLVRREDRKKEDSIQCKVMKSPKNDGHEPLGENDGEVKKEPVQEDKREKKAEKVSTVAGGECVSWTHNWITVGLTESARSSSKALCYITIPLKVTKVITCKVVDGLSSLMVSGSEELVSNVLRLENSSNIKCPFPLTVAVPFQACYRLNYREVTVKVVDQEQRISYVTPEATEGIYGGRRGTFAVVRVYALGVFAVLSRFQRETFTIPKRGLSLKLSVDSRICLDYLPGSFTTPALAQAMVQPVDAMLLSTLKCRNDSYHSILTTSPLLYLNHPSTVTLRRPLTLTLPCPPNPDKRKTGKENSPTDSSGTALTPDTLSAHRVRVLSVSVRSKELSKEQLVVLGWKNEHWNVLDTVSVRNPRNGLVSFELIENYERLIALRLRSSVRPSCLASFAEELQESVRTCAVTVVIHKRWKDPSSVVLAVLPSRDLSWGLAELQAQAYCATPDQSAEILMREGEQLLLKFSGNITSTDDRGADHTITFHNQRRNRLYLQLKELDPFGNYSSPHYKGTTLLFRIPKDQLVWRGDRAVISEDYCLGEPACKLPLSLPKTVKTLSRPMSAKFVGHDQAEPLCDELLSWLCSELSEEDAALLAMCLRLRRSSVQLARLRAPGSLALQTFHILTTWRQALPSFTPKCPLLARCLTRIGRPELAAELLRKGPAVSNGEGRGAETQRPVTVYGPPLH